MRKTSIYLTDEEILLLRNAAQERRKPQAELIREAIREPFGSEPSHWRVFHSMGKGRSGQRAAHGAWRSDDLYNQVMGRNR